MLFLIFIIAFALRLIALNQSLWLDEAITALAAKNSIHQLIFSFAKGDFHPPLYYVFLHVWIQFFGNSEISLRMPSVIFGVGIVYYIYKIAEHFYDKKTAHIAAILGATAPLLIYYSQEARMYTAAAFFVSASFYYFSKCLKQDRFWDWFLFILTSVAFLYTDYVPYFMIPVFLICLLLISSKRLSRKIISFLPAFLIILSAIAPWFYIFLKQFNFGISAIKSSPAWAQVLGEATSKNLLLVFVKFIIGRISISNNFLYALIVGLVLLYASFLMVLYVFRLSKERLSLFVWFFVPVFAGFVVSLFVPIFSYFRFLFCLPPLYIMLASGINNVNSSKITRPLLSIALAINLICAFVYLLNPKFQREDWRTATNFVVTNSGPDSIILFEMASPPAPFVYYLKSNIKASGALENLNAENGQVMDKVKALTKNKSKVFLFQYLSGITDPQGYVFSNLVKADFSNSKTKDFNGVGFVYIFTKNK